MNKPEVDKKLEQDMKIEVISTMVISNKKEKPKKEKKKKKREVVVVIWT